MESASSQTPRVALTVHTMMVGMVSAETVNIIIKTVVVSNASAEMVEKVTNSEAMVQVACTVLNGQGNRCSTQSVRSKGLAGQGLV